MTVLFSEGLTEIEPYGFITDTPALGPTAKRYSFLLAQRTVPATIMPSATIFVARLLTIEQLPQASLRTFQSLWLRTIHRHLKKHGFLLIRIHQRPPGILIVRSLIHRALRLADGLIHPPQILFVLRSHCGRVGRNLF